MIGGNWATTSQVWFDPNQFWTPFTLENVYGVEICVQHIPENYCMERIGEVMPNIETLYLLGKVNDFYWMKKGGSCNNKVKWGQEDF